MKIKFCKVWLMVNNQEKPNKRLKLDDRMFQKECEGIVLQILKTQEFNANLDV